MQTSTQRGPPLRGDVEEALQGRSPRRRCAQLIPFPPRKALLRPSARAPLSPVARTHLQIYETHVPFLRPHTSSLLIGAMLSGRAGGRLVCSRASHHSLVVHHARHCPLPLPCPTIAAPTSHRRRRSNTPSHLHVPPHRSSAHPGRVGKTSILLRYCRDTYDDRQQSTLQASYLDKQIMVGDKVRCCRGQESLN